MNHWVIVILFLISTQSFAQSDTASLHELGKETVLSEVVIRSDLNVEKFLLRVKEDTTFYKAFRSLRIIGFTSLNDIRIINKDGSILASLYSKTRQNRVDGCRTMEVLEEKSTGDMYDHGKLNYYTAQLYSGLFFTRGKICGENNIVSGIERNVQGKTGIEKHKEQLKMLFFNPGKKIPGIPFIGDKIDIFNRDVAQYYDFSIDMQLQNGVNCYVFKIESKPDLTSSQKDHIVFDNITTWFDAKSLEIIALNYDLSYNTPFYDFDVHMEVQMTHAGQVLVPQLLRYTGDWKVAFRKRERAQFTATLSDFKNN